MFERDIPPFICHSLGTNAQIFSLQWRLRGLPTPLHLPQFKVLSSRTALYVTAAHCCFKLISDQLKWSNQPGAVSLEGLHSRLSSSVVLIFMFSLFFYFVVHYLFMASRAVSEKVFVYICMQKPSTQFSLESFYIPESSLYLVRALLN